MFVSAENAFVGECVCIRVFVSVYKYVHDCMRLWLVFVAASHQTRLDTRSKARRPIKVGIKGRGGRERAETRTLFVCAAHRLT